jgi:hypothetical protein
MKEILSELVEAASDFLDDEETDSINRNRLTHRRFPTVSPIYIES